MSEKDIFQGVNIRNLKILTGKIKGTLMPYQSYSQSFRPSILHIPEPKYYPNHGNSFLSFQPSPVDDTGLKAYWKFDESSGKIINQSQSAIDMGATADLTVTGATFGAVGKIGDALDFDGINDECSADDSVVADWNWMHQNGATLTTVFWYAKDFPDTKAGDMLCTSFAFTAGLLTRFNPARTVNIFYGAGDFTTFTTGVIVPNDTNYHFYEMRYDDATGVMGVNFDDGTESTDAGNNLTNTTDAQRVLGLAFDTNASFFDGRMDETSMWDARLSDARLTILFGGGAGQEIY